MNAALPPHKSKSSLSQNLRALALRNFLFGLRANMVRAIWQPFVLHLGASMSLLGLLESIGGYGGLVSTAMLPLGGWLSDRRGRKPFVVMASLFGLAALATLALAGWVMEWRLLLPGVVLLGLVAIARPAVDCITAESASLDARGRAFSLTGVAFAASGIFAPTLGGLIADRYGFLAVLVAGALMESITLCVVGISLRETLPAEDRAALRASELLALMRRVITPPARLRSFYIAVTIDMFAFGTGAAILFGLLSETYHFTPLQLGLMSSAQSVTWTISQLFAGRQVDERGCVPFLVFSEALAGAVTMGWLVAKSFTAFLILHAVLGFAVATWVPAFLAWIANSVPESQRAEEMGRLGAFRGLLSFPASYVGGLLYDVVGFRGPILANLIGAAIVTVLLWRFVGEPQPHPVRRHSSPRSCRPVEPVGPNGALCEDE